MKQPKMKAINLLKAAKDIENLVSHLIKVRSVEIRFSKNEHGSQLSSTIFYNGKEYGKEYSNFTAWIYEFNSELTIENLILEVEKEIQKQEFYKKLLA